MTTTKNPIDRIAELPEPFNNTTPGAWAEHGCRQLSWSINEPGELHRNKFDRAWIDLIELRPWDSSTLIVRALRRHSRSGLGRDRFSEKGRAAIGDELRPAIEAIGGFDSLWLALHRRSRLLDSAHDHDAAETLRRRADWWIERAAVTKRWAEGDLIPVETPAGTPDHVWVPCGDGDIPPSVERVARALVTEPDGRVVGYLTDRASVVPATPLP